MRYTYLLTDLFTVMIPLIFSFHPKIRFYKNWSALFPSLIGVALIFVCWDFSFTSAGVWYFNPLYITGVHVYDLPLEEVLFFICIPYSCVFTYHCLDTLYKIPPGTRRENIFYLFLSISLLALGIACRQRPYTAVTAISTGLLCMLLPFVFRVKWFGKALRVYGILLLPFFIVNGILTGTGLEEPVVGYNPAAILGIRIGTVPVEDIVYGFELFVLNLAAYEFLIKRRKPSHETARR